MTDEWNPLDEVPSRLSPDERRAFWDEVARVNTERAFRPCDADDEAYPAPPGSLRAEWLRLYDELDGLWRIIETEVLERIVKPLSR